MSANLLTLESSKTKFRIMGLRKKQISKIDNSALNTTKTLTLHAALVLFLMIVLSDLIRSHHFFKVLLFSYPRAPLYKSLD